MSAADFRTLLIAGRRASDVRTATVIDGSFASFVHGEGIRLALGVYQQFADALETDLGGLTSVTCELLHPVSNAPLFSGSVAVPPVSSLTHEQFTAGLGWHAAWEIPNTAFALDFNAGRSAVALEIYGTNAAGKVWYARGRLAVHQTAAPAADPPPVPPEDYITAAQLAAALAGLNLPVIYPSLAALQTATGPGKFWDANYLYERPYTGAAIRKFATAQI